VSSESERHTSVTLLGYKKSSIHLSMFKIYNICVT